MANARPDSGTLTFVFADLVGATPLYDRLGDEPADAIVDANVRLLADTVSQCGGSVAKYLGDGLMAVFASALDAVACAVAMQRAVHDDQGVEDEHPPLLLRVGAHSGEPIRRGEDYFGTPVIVGSRLGSIAQPDQIIVSDVVRGLVGSRGSFMFQELGPRPLRGISNPVTVFEVVWRPVADSASPLAPPAPPRAEPARTAAVDAASVHDTAVILFADIVDSTSLTERVGDAAFRRRADELDASIRAIIRAGGGTPQDGKAMGDGVMAVFTSARQAIDAASRCAKAGGAVELALHLGIHAGDVIRRADNVFGGAVNIAARICDLSAPNEILVSGTVRDLARTSAGVAFEDRGEHEMKGVGEAVRLFAVRERD